MYKCEICDKELKRKGSHSLKHAPEKMKSFREKVSKALMGNTRALGRKMTTEQRKKISESLRGNTRTLGHKLSDEHKAKISKHLVGNKYTLGRKLPPEEREAKAKILREVGKPTQFKKGASGGLFWKGKFIYSSGETTHYFKSSYEVRFAKCLDSLGKMWLYEPKMFIIGPRKGYIPDFFIEAENTYYEVKGWFSPSSKEKIKLFEKKFPCERLKLVFLEDIEKMEEEAFGGSTCQAAAV